MVTKTAQQLWDTLKALTERYNRTQDYHQLYEDHAKFEDEYWKNKSHPSYKADLWYCRNRNQISLSMLGDICADKKVLAIGARAWVETEFLAVLKCGELVRTDLIPDVKHGIIEADAAALPFEDASFDMVIMREVIEHVIDEQAVYSEVKRVLRPQGYMHISTPSAFVYLPEGVFHKRAYTPCSFLAELEAQGFEIIKKGGNVPYILSALLPLTEQGFKTCLKEFQLTSELTKDYNNMYYICTQMFVLAQKK